MASQGRLTSEYCNSHLKEPISQKVTYLGISSLVDLLESLDKAGYDWNSEFGRRLVSLIEDYVPVERVDFHKNSSHHFVPSEKSNS